MSRLQKISNRFTSLKCHCTLTIALNNGNINIENVGGAIESWMRRVASKAKDAMEPTERAKMGRASVGASSKGVQGIGDLIEMTDEFEIGDEDDDDDDEGERGRQGSADTRILHTVGGGGGSSSSYLRPGATATGAGKRERSKADHFGKSGKDD
jgi:hypothetical protein